VEELEIGLLGELRWVTAVLLVCLIEDWGAAVGLPTVTRGRGGNRVTEGDRSRRDQVNCVCANARVRVLEALGGAQDPGEDSIMRKQELALRQRAWRHGEARMAAMRHGGRKGGPAQGRESGGEAGE
jgi:hypothetical protein